MAPPPEHMIGRLCEEFRCLPSQIEGEDIELLLTIMDLRSYAAAKEEYDAGGTRADRVPKAMVKDLDAVKERQARRWSAQRRRRKKVVVSQIEPDSTGVVE